MKLEVAWIQARPGKDKSSAIHTLTAEYAARIARADELAQSGDMSAGVSELLSAEQLLPQRGEAPALLHALTASSGPG